jgi:hypothetical protein
VSILGKLSQSTSGYFLDKERFDKLSEDEKAYYVNKKIIKSSSLYPWEIPYLTFENLKKIRSKRANYLRRCRLRH